MQTYLIAKIVTETAANREKGLSCNNPVISVSTEDIWITGEQLTQGTHYRDNNLSFQDSEDLHKIWTIFVDYLYVYNTFNNQLKARNSWGWPMRGQTRGDAMLWGRVVIITGDEMSRHWPLSRWHGAAAALREELPPITEHWVTRADTRHVEPLETGSR